MPVDEPDSSRLRERLDECRIVGRLPLTGVQDLNGQRLQVLPRLLELVRCFRVVSVGDGGRNHHDFRILRACKSEEGITDEVREVLVPAAGEEQRARRRSDLLRRCLWQTGENTTPEGKHNEKWNSA